MTLLEKTKWLDDDSFVYVNSGYQYLMVTLNQVYLGEQDLTC